MGKPDRSFAAVEPTAEANAPSRPNQLRDRYQIATARGARRPQSVAPGPPSQMSAFAAVCEQRTGAHFADHRAFHAFSVREPARFWSLFLERSGILHDGAVEPALTNGDCERAAFFPNLRVGYVETLLRIDGELGGDLPALTSYDGRNTPTRYTRRELATRVAATAVAFEALGIAVGDRAVAVVHNDAHAAIAGLGALALGATLSTASTQMGAFSILARFAPLEPTLLICHTDGSSDGTSAAESCARLIAIARGLPSLKAVVVLGDGPLPTGLSVPVHRWATLAQHRDATQPAFVWRRFPFNHPLFILFSSGTTGPPKCLVHGAGGTLLEHAKEHRLHGDLRPGDKLFFHTSCAWMMWNWQLSALATGAEVVLFSGAVRGPETLWRIVADERVTVFGTSPAYLQMCADAQLAPNHLTLRHLRVVLSTGSILHEHLYDWVGTNVGPVPLHSISGGSDIIGCFTLGHPDLPVVRGESPCLSLGLDVRSMLASGTEPTSKVGELVCAGPFPSRPLGLYGDERGERYHAAYFAAHPGVWTHGDLVEIDARGGVRMHGRSDDVLNVHGVRIGPAEIHRILLTSPELRDSAVVEQPTVGAPGSSRLILCVVMAPACVLDGAMRRKIRHALRTLGSPAHVPELIIAVAELPRTHNGKLSERAVRDVVRGLAVANADALQNPASLTSLRAALDASLRDDQHASGVLAFDELSGTSLARVVTASWEHVLDVAPIARDEDFFALGGTSMLALQLCNELHVRTGWECSPALLARAPTIAAMCEALEARDAPPAALVSLRAGTGDPLFVVHGLAGDTLQLRTLAQLLPGDRPVVGIQARGLDARSVPLATVEAMAADYVKRLKTAQPAGPYAVLGYSFGGLVAFEMARLLRARGDEVSFLGMLDTGMHDGCLPWPQQAAFRLLRKAHRALSAAPVQRPREWFDGRDAMRAAIEGRLHANTSRGSPPPYETAPMTPAMRRVIDQVWAAFRALRPQRCRQAIAYFQASVRPPAYCYPIPIWNDASYGGVTIIRVPGDHFTMIQAPNVGELAQRVGEALARAGAMG